VFYLLFTPDGLCYQGYMDSMSLVILASDIIWGYLPEPPKILLLQSSVVRSYLGSGRQCACQVQELMTATLSASNGEVSRAATA
jgi:hypothetical protein